MLDKALIKAGIITADDAVCMTPDEIRRLFALWWTGVRYTNPPRIASTLATAEDLNASSTSPRE